jgi:hypothetical protein
MKYQKGQATAEFIVSIIGILSVFTGFFLIVDLGVAKVENVLAARAEADFNSYNGIIGGSGSAILTWTEGSDSFLYTEDDLMSVSTTENPDTFSDELQNDDFSLLDDFSMTYVENNFAATLDPDRVFLPAANLTSGTSTDSVELDEATRLLYFDTPSISVTDSMYMPFIY